MGEAMRGITRRLALALLPGGFAAAWLGQGAEARPLPRPEDLVVGEAEGGEAVFERDVFEPGVFE